MRLLPDEERTGARWRLHSRWVGHLHPTDALKTLTLSDMFGHGQGFAAAEDKAQGKGVGACHTEQRRDLFARIRLSERAVPAVQRRFDPWRILHGY